MKKIFTYIRLKDWWNYIVPPVMSFFYMGLLTTDTTTSSISDVIQRTLSFFLLTIFVAAFGFFLNEWTDVKDDQAAGKINSLANVANYKINLIFLFLISGIMVTSSLIKWETYLFALLIFQLLLFFLYSVYPFRLKRNKYGAVIIDALYSGTIFYILSFMFGSNLHAFNVQLVFILFFWAFCRGIRNILYHLIQDRKYDILIPVQTIATNEDIILVQKKIKTILLPLEIICYLVFLYLLPFHFIFICLYLLFLCYVYFRKEYIIPFFIKRKKVLKQEIMTDINLFYEIIMPILTLCLLVCRDFRMVLVLCLSLLLFPQVFNWLLYLYIGVIKKK